MRAHFLADIESDERLQPADQDALDHIQQFKDKSFLEKRHFAAIKSKKMNVFLVVLSQKNELRNVFFFNFPIELNSYEMLFSLHLYFIYIQCNCVHTL